MVDNQVVGVLSTKGLLRILHIEHRTVPCTASAAYPDVTHDGIDVLVASRIETYTARIERNALAGSGLSCYGKAALVAYAKYILKVNPARHVENDGYRLAWILVDGPA